MREKNPLMTMFSSPRITQRHVEVPKKFTFTSVIISTSTVCFAILVTSPVKASLIFRLHTFSVASFDASARSSARGRTRIATFVRGPGLGCTTLSVAPGWTAELCNTNCSGHVSFHDLRVDPFFFFFFE